MLILAVLLAAASPPPAATHAAPAPGASTAKPAKEKMICRKEVDTGTRINRRRICAPARVWDDLRQEHLDSSAQRNANAERGRQCSSIPCRP